MSLSLINLAEELVVVFVSNFKLFYPRKLPIENQLQKSLLSFQASLGREEERGREEDDEMREESRRSTLMRNGLTQKHTRKTMNTTPNDNKNEGGEEKEKKVG